MYKNFAIAILAGGSSQRFGTNKLLTVLNGKPVLIHSVETFLKVVQPQQIVVVISKEHKKTYEQILHQYFGEKILKIIIGGQRRQDSAFKAINALDNYKYIAIHDAARPYLSERLIRLVFDKALIHSSAVCAVAINDTIKKINENDRVIETISRETLCTTQTPQVFLTKKIHQAYEKFTNLLLTDEAMAMEKNDEEVYIYKHSEQNSKITYKEDLDL